MTEEKTLLQQIREKELLISIQIEDSRREAGEILVAARKEAAERVLASEKEGETAARSYYENEMEKIKKETEHLRSEGARQAASARDAGERNLPQAIEKIVKSVSME
jgi:vacuolar-type H+-ATPase subunit H